MTQPETSVQKGQLWRDRWHATIEVTRVARDGAWADIHVYQGATGSDWTKRQPLPFPFSWERVR